MKTFTRISALVVFILLLAGVITATPTNAKPAPHFRVDGDAGWFATGLTFTSGDSLSFTAHGRAMTGPLSQYPDARSNANGQVTICTITAFPFIPCAMEAIPYGALVGKFGPSGTPFFIGTSLSLTANESGELFLAVNDNDGTYFDNFGGFMVFVGP